MTQEHEEVNNNDDFIERDGVRYRRATTEERNEILANYPEGTRGKDSVSQYGIVERLVAGSNFKEGLEDLVSSDDRRALPAALGKINRIKLGSLGAAIFGRTVYDLHIRLDDTLEE